MTSRPSAGCAAARPSSSSTTARPTPRWSPGSRPRCEARHRVRHVVSERLGGHRARRERDRRRRLGQAVRRRHGRAAVHAQHGVARLVAERHRQLQLVRARRQVSRHRGFPAALCEEGGRGQGRPARLLPAAVQLRDRPDARAGDQRDQEPRPQEARRLPAQERDADHRRPDPLRPGRRMGESARDPRAVPRRRRQGHGSVPAARQAGDPVAGAVQDRRGYPAVPESAREINIDLLAEAVLFGILVGCFYAAVSVGLSVAFGLLDVPHVAHPALMVLGSYCTYLLGLYGWDPIVAGIALTPLFFLLGIAIYRFYYETFEKRGSDAGLRGLAFFFGLAFIIEVALILVFGVDQRMVEADYIGRSLSPGGYPVPR